MSMYAIHETAIHETAIHETAIKRVTSHPATAPPQPYLRLVGPPSPPGSAPRAVFWRRRLAVLLVAVAVVLTAKALVGGSHGGTSHPGSVAPAAVAEAGPQGSYVVKQGDTLWAIARQMQPGGDVRPVVDRLAALRRGEPLRVGERIALPRGG